MILFVTKTLNMKTRKRSCKCVFCNGGSLAVKKFAKPVRDIVLKFIKEMKGLKMNPGYKLKLYSLFEGQRTELRF